jgi:hypothetical protein
MNTERITDMLHEKQQLLLNFDGTLDRERWLSLIERLQAAGLVNAADDLLRRYTHYLDKMPMQEREL